MQGCQIVVTGCEICSILFTETIPAIKLCPSKCLCQIKTAHRGVEGGVWCDIIGVSVTGFSPVKIGDLP